MVDPLIDAINSAKDYGDCYLYGYRVTELALIAELLIKNHISEDDLHSMFVNFSKMYNIIVAQHQLEIKKVMNSMVLQSTYPSEAEVAMRMCPLDMEQPLAKSMKIRPWNDLRKGE
jgi:hypothetical protein